MTREQLIKIYQQLFDHYGPQHWWPANTDLEMILGAVLVQNTRWQRAVAALEALQQADLIDITKLHDLSAAELSEHIRSAGYYRLKAKRLKNLIAMIVVNYEANLHEMLRSEPTILRENLLEVNGIGPETADCIMLYAAKHPKFVIDAYTQRLFKRHGWIDKDLDYHVFQSHFEQVLPADVYLFNEYHALIVRVGNERCGRRPKCEGCALEHLLPNSGIVE